MGAAVVAGLLLPHLHALNLEGCVVELDRGDLVLVTPAARIVWGRARGRNGPTRRMRSRSCNDCSISRRWRDRSTTCGRPTA